MYTQIISYTSQIHTITCTINVSKIYIHVHVCTCILYMHCSSCTHKFSLVFGAVTVLRDKQLLNETFSNITGRCVQVPYRRLRQHILKRKVAIPIRDHQQNPIGRDNKVRRIDLLEPLEVFEIAFLRDRRERRPLPDRP